MTESPLTPFVDTLPLPKRLLATERRARDEKLNQAVVLKEVLEEGIRKS